MIRPHAGVLAHQIHQLRRGADERHPGFDAFGKEKFDFRFQRGLVWRTKDEVVGGFFNRRFIPPDRVTVAFERVPLFDEFVRRPPQIARVPHLGNDLERDLRADAAD